MNRTRRHLLRLAPAGVLASTGLPRAALSSLSALTGASALSGASALTGAAALTGASALATATYAPAARAQAWPTRPVRVVVGFAAGGGADIVARQVGVGMGERLGQTIVVDNRPGATGTIAATSVAKSPADGYSIMLASQSTIIVVPAIQKKLPFVPVRDFAPVTLLVRMPMLLVVGQASPFQSLAQLLEAAGKEKGALSYASAGAGGPQHVAGELLANQAGVSLIHVPYKGEAPAIADLIGGVVPMMFANLPAITPHVQSGRVRVLAISSAERHPSLPDVPTVAEAGKLAGFDVETWYGLFAPTGTPADIIGRIEDAAVRTLQDPPVRAKLAEQGFTIVGNSSEAFTGFVRDQTERWGKLIADANIQAD